MIMCSVNQLAKTYGGNSIFEHISLELKEKERVGLVGRNGSGKTTLLKLLANEEAPDAGQIHWKRGATIGYLSQIPDFPESYTAKDVLKTAFTDMLQMEEKMKAIEEKMAKEAAIGQLENYMEEYGILQDEFSFKGGYEIEATIEKVSHGLNIHPLLNKPFSVLSGGEKTKITLGYILLKNPDFLLLDEPTNHLDLMAVEWLGKFLQDYPGTVLIVSHDRYFLDEVVTRIVDMEDGELVNYHTNFTGYVQEKEERLLREFQAYEEQQKKIKKMKEAIKRLRIWANQANPPNEGLHKRARNMERALERMDKRNRPQLQRKKMNLKMDAADRSGKDVVFFREVSKRFGEKQLFQHVNLHVTYQQRVAIIGENGTGKSTLIQLMLHRLQPDEGEVKLGSNVKVGYLSQHVFSDAEDETIIDAFRSQVQVTEGEARNILARFLFYGPTVFQKLSQLSGGERMRLRLAQLMYQDTNLLVLDEPTNHLDIESREVLEDTLETYDGTILAVSHDRYFLDQLFEKIYWIDRGAVIGFEGNYTYAKDKMKERALSVDTAPQKKSERPTRKRNIVKSDNRKELFSQLEELEAAIIQLEQQLEEEKDLEKLQSIFTEKEALEQRWEELSEKV